MTAGRSGGVWSACLALALLGAAGPARPAPQAAADAAELGYRDAYLAFAELLARFQRGEDAVLGELRAAGSSFAERFGREDARGVVEYYAALDASERARGWSDYETFDGLWRRVAEAEPESWAAERERVLDELRAFVARTIGAPDVVPAARALSLCARIEVEELAGLEAEDVVAREELLERALQDARSSLSIFERAGHLTPRLEPLWLLGRLEHMDGRLFAARERFEECLRAAEQVRSDVWREHALVGLVRLARAAGDPLRVDALLDELAAFREPEESWWLAREHALRAVAEDLPEVALRFLERCRPAGGAALVEWRRFAGLARLRAGELAAARELLLDGAEAEGEDALLARATLALAEGRTEAVLEELGDAGARADLSAHGRMFALSLAGEALLREDRAEEAEALLLEAIDEAGRFEARLAEMRLLGGTTASVFGERLGLHTIALCAEARARAGRGLEAALLVESSQSRRLGAADLEAEDLVAWARRHEHGLVTFVCGADAGLALHVSREGAVDALPIRHGRRALSEGARRLREAALEGDAERAAALGGELARELLPAALRAELARADGGSLLLLAHGPIERLPVELLRVEGATLDARCAPLVLPGLPSRRPPEQLDIQRAGEWILLGDPRDVGGRPELPAAAAELAAIAASHPGALLLARERYERAAVRDALASGRPLHFATHLLRSEDCADGRLASVGLELDAGELLCAREVGEHARPLPLVVLSACETAEGRFLDAEGLLGLARAFLETGTRNLLVTLWPVRDDAASAFSPAFHRALLAGALPSQAARAARAELREAGFGPGDWAAFRLLGAD